MLGPEVTQLLEVLVDVLHRSDPVFGGVGFAIALGLILTLGVLLQRGRRRKIKGSVWLLFLHAATAAPLAFIDAPAVESKLSLVAAFFLLASLGRSAFLLLVDTFLARRAMQPVPQILRDVLQAALYVVIGLLVLRAAGVEPGSLLTTSALLTAVLGLSLQETLGNLFAGLAIQAQRPFDVGDWIQCDQNAVGKVIEINWRATRVLTIDDIEVVVPNSAVAKAPIYNYSRPTTVVRRAVTVPTSYDAPPEAVRKILLEALADTPRILDKPEPTIATKDFSDRGVMYEVRFYIQDYHARDLIDSDVRDRIWYALKRNGLPIPFPQRRLDFQPASAGPDPKKTEQRATKLLQHSELFSHLSEQDARSIIARCSRQLFTKQERIVRQNTLGSEMFIIERGRVGISVALEKGRHELLAQLGPGEFFGEMSVMTGGERTADVIALEETEVLVLTREALAPLLESQPELADHISQVLAERQVQRSEVEGQEEAPRETRDQQEMLGRIREFFSL